LPSEADAKLQVLLDKVEEGAKDWLKGSEGISNVIFPPLAKVTLEAGVTVAELLNFSSPTWPLGASSSSSSSSIPPAIKKD